METIASSLLELAILFVGGVASVISSRMPTPVAYYFHWRRYNNNAYQMKGDWDEPGNSWVSRINELAGASVFGAALFTGAIFLHSHWIWELARLGITSLCAGAILRSGFAASREANLSFRELADCILTYSDDFSTSLLASIRQGMTDQEYAEFAMRELRRPRHYWEVSQDEADAYSAIVQPNATKCLIGTAIRFSLIVIPNIVAFAL